NIASDCKATPLFPGHTVRERAPPQCQASAKDTERDTGTSLCSSDQHGPQSPDAWLDLHRRMS
ncbi:hypothetical protein BaRGS_00023145, partial [Batillaria attramentaria]